VNYVAFSEYCVESRDRNACCYKIRIFIASVLYALVLHGGWVSTKQLHGETRIPYEYIAMSLRKLQRHGLAERVYVPGTRGIASLWRVRDDILNGYDRKRVLNVLKKHIEMCLAKPPSTGVHA
jgi:DNA-binding transcriptional regulator GbsR (MarR family)